MIKKLYKDKSNEKLIIWICFLVLLASFFLPVMIQPINYNRKSEITEKIVFYGYMDVFYYLNLIVVLLMTKNGVIDNFFSPTVEKVYTFKKVRYIIFSTIYFSLYVLITYFIAVTFSWGREYSAKIGYGIYVNVVSTFILIILIYKSKMNFDS